MAEWCETDDCLSTREARDMFARGDYDSNEQQRERMRRWIAGVDPMGKM